MKQKFLTRNFILLIFGQVSSLIGNFTLKFSLSMYVLEQTGSASVFAGLLAMALLPTILLSPFGGILADRANRRNIMVALDTLSGLSVLVACIVMPFGHDILIIGILLVILSILGAFESPTVQACIPQMLSGDHIVKGNAVINQVAAIASLITPFLGSVFYTTFGIQPVFYAAMLCFFMTALFECFIRLDDKEPKHKMKIRAMVKEDFSLSMRFLCREQPGILKLLLLAALVSLFVAGTAVVGFPYLVRTVLGLSAEHYGVAESAMGIAAILRRPVCGGAGREATAAPSCWRFFVLWNLPDSLRDCLLAAGGRFYTVYHFAFDVLCLPVWMQYFLHLCNFHDSGEDAGAPDGQGNVLCVHPFHVRTADRADGLRGIIRPVF